MADSRSWRLTLTSIYSDEYQRIIDRLVTARKDAGITQQGIADALGRPQSFVSKYERCERRLDVVEYAHICRLIGVDPGEVNVTVTWTPSNSSGGTIFIQLDYQYNFLIGGLVGLDPIALQGDSAMVVL